MLYKSPRGNVNDMVEQYGFDSGTASKAHKDEAWLYALEYGITPGAQAAPAFPDDAFETNRLTGGDYE
ncbi:MAG: hypothetical protein ACOYJD_08895 [Christensenellales bacterium]|jgi:hypothetical protein